MASVSATIWTKRAARLGEALPVSVWHPRVVTWARSSPAHQNWGVAFSGGADSLALLLLLWAHWPEHRSRLTALHFNHRLRGRASNADERFCRTVARGLGIRFKSAQWKARRKGASEAEARTARHSFFEDELRRLKTPVLWTGHHQDDIAETLLMRLARGSGSSGLAAPRPIQWLADERVHLRPLLTLKKEEIAKNLKALSIPWREDASNHTSKYLRNRIRTDVIPSWQLATGGRDTLSGAALSRELLEEDDAALDDWVRRLNPITPTGRLNLGRLAGVPKAVARRALHRWLIESAPNTSLSRQAFESLLNDVMKPRRTRHSLGRDTFATIVGSRMKIEPARQKVSN
jgi:tRNA(Ile)-lysidine synthase